MGATFMPPSEARNLPPELRLVRILGPAPESRLVMGWRSDIPPGPTLAALIDLAS